MNEVVDFEETESLNEDIFDCEYNFEYYKRNKYKKNR